MNSLQHRRGVLQKQTSQQQTFDSIEELEEDRGCPLTSIHQQHDLKCNGIKSAAFGATAIRESYFNGVSASSPSRRPLLEPGKSLDSASSSEALYPTPTPKQRPLAPAAPTKMLNDYSKRWLCTSNDGASAAAVTPQPEEEVPPGGSVLRSAVPAARKVPRKVSLVQTVVKKKSGGSVEEEVLTSYDPTSENLLGFADLLQIQKGEASQVCYVIIL